MNNSELDENNLHYLNEEISHYDVLEDDYQESPKFKFENYLSKTKQVENDYINKLGYDTACHTNMNNFKENNNLNYKEINTEALKVKELEKINKNLKKTVSYLQKKITQIDEQKTDSKINVKRISELEQENSHLASELEKMRGVLNIKDDLFQEFQNLVLVSNNKFKKLEDSNSKNEQIRKVNEELKARINQLTQKEMNYNNQLVEINELKDKINKYADEKMSEFKLNEENARKILEEKENNIRQKFMKKEEELKAQLLNEVSNFQREIEKSKIDLEKSKRENKDLQDKLENLECLITNKENNYKKLSDYKDQENEKLLNMYKQVQNEKNNYEIQTNEKTTEYLNNYNNMQEILRNLEKESEEKDCLIKQMNEEIQNYKQSLSDIDVNFSEIKLQFERREKVTEMLKNENMEIVREYNKLVGENEELKHNNEKIMSEFNELKSNYDSTNARLNEINELYEEILKTKEKENNTIINLEKTNKDLMKRLKNIELQYNKDVNGLKNVIMQKNEETEKIVDKYENKFILLKLKIEEQKYANDNLINEINNFKDLVDNYESSVNEKQLNSSKYNINLDKYPTNPKNDGYQKQIINDLKNLITKMDVKISNTQVPNKSMKY